MTKQQSSKVLNNLKEIHSLQANGVILSLLRDLRGYKSQVESLQQNLNSRIKLINKEKEEKIEKEKELKQSSNSVKILQDDNQMIQSDEDKIITSSETIKQQNNVETNSETNSELSIKNTVKDDGVNDSKSNKDNKNDSQSSKIEYGEKRIFNNQHQNSNKSWNGKVNTKKDSQTQGNRPLNSNFKTNNNYQGNNYNNSKNNQGNNRGNSQNFVNQNSNKPFNKNGFNSRSNPQFSGNKSNFASTKANAFKSFVPEITEIREQRNYGNKNKSPNRGLEEKRNGLSKKQLMRRNYIDTNPDIEERMGSRRISRPKKKQETPHIAPTIENAIITSENVTVKTLSEKIGKPVPEIIKQLMILGVLATINSSIDFATAELVSSELGVKLEQKIEQTYEDKLLDVSKQDQEDADAQPRPPVVAVMGHVDHGKTSLLDAIRKTNVASGEAGGITQKIGAYSITHNGEKITFIDTPGHAAFTSMRARGAKITDIAVLVVAADDGVMPQTLEAINHIKAANVPMIVAVNKMDAVDANVERVKTQLAANGVLPEDWGGETIIVPVSAKTGVGIEELINMILLVAEVNEFKANPNKMATGTIIEATLDRTKGPIATVLVQSGTLEVGNSIMSGITFGKVRAMFDENGKAMKKAGPSTPVSVLGFYDVPSSGDQVFAVSEKLSKQVIEERKTKIKEQQALTTSGVTLDDFMNKVNEGKLKSLNIIIKADSQGSVEALKQSLTVIANEEVRVVCIHNGVGAVTESDIVLAKASNAVIINFNLKVPSKIQTIADHTGVEIKQYNIIYEVVEDITKAITGMLSIKYEQVVTGHAEIRMVFKLSTNGLIAGSYVTDGKIIRNAMGRLIRNGEVIADTKIIDLKIVKDDKAEVPATFECGIKLEDVPNLKEGDIIECYQNVEIKRG